MKVIENEKCMIKGCENPVADKDFVLVVWDAPLVSSVRICNEHKEFSGHCKLNEFKDEVYK